MYVKFVVYKYNYNKLTKAYDASPETVADAYDVQVSVANGSKKDTFNFKINNNRNTRNWSFKAQDKVNVYQCINGATPADSNMIINGLVKKVTEDLATKKKALRIEGVSFSEVTTTALVFYDPGTETQNVMQYLNKCVTEGIAKWFVNTGAGDASAFMIGWNADNPTVKSDGSAFPVFTQAGAKRRDYYKSLNKVLDTYLANSYTKDGSYYWYVNNAKELCIRKRKSTSEVVYNWTEGVDFKTGKVAINTESVYNFIVVKCGFDLNGNPVSTRYDDPVSRASNGFRYYMLVEMNITQDLIASDKTITNANLITAARAIGYARGEEYAKLHNSGFFTIQAVTKPTVAYQLGDRVSITLPSYANYNESTGTSLVNKKMMITDIQWTMDSTLFTLEEEGAV